MVIRVICLILAVVVPLGWLTLLFAIGAILLPYFAVIIANSQGSQSNQVTKLQAPTISISADSFKAGTDEK